MLLLEGHCLPLKSFLGAGSTSRAYRSVLAPDSRPVVLKVPMPGHSTVREADMLRLVAGCPGVPNLVGVTDDGSSLVLEPVGETLDLGALNRVKGLGRALPGLVDTLQAAHERHSVVQGDVRPENIIAVMSSPPCLAASAVQQQHAAAGLPSHGAQQEPQQAMAAAALEQLEIAPREEDGGGSDAMGSASDDGDAHMDDAAAEEASGDVPAALSVGQAARRQQAGVVKSLLLIDW